jgi:8-oxo-dGTP diphosphatase
MANKAQNLKPGKDYVGVGGGVLIFNEKGEVLLKKRSKKSKNEVGFWQQLGGSIDYGEKVINAVRREIKEEAGIEIKIWGLLPHTDQILNKDKQHWLAVNYLADIKSGDVKNMEPEKCDKMFWFSFKKLPKKIGQPTRESIKNYLAGKYMKL